MRGSCVPGIDTAPKRSARAASCERSPMHRRITQIAWPHDVRHHSAAVPTYDYQCRSCGSVTEVIHSMLEEGPSVCERCGGELRRVLYPTGIIFKGSGFYRTDSRSSGTTSSDAKPSGGDAATTKESKPKASTTETTKGSGDSGT
jgi:putative FmdB family regulatory protein